MAFFRRVTAMFMCIVWSCYWTVAENWVTTGWFQFLAWSHSLHCTTRLNSTQLPVELSRVGSGTGDRAQAAPTRRDRVLKERCQHGAWRDCRPTHVEEEDLEWRNWRKAVVLQFAVWSLVGLCESSFLLLKYSIEYLTEYSSTRIPTDTGCDKLNVNGKWPPITEIALYYEFNGGVRILTG